MEKNNDLRLLVYTPSFDHRDPIFGFSVRWMREMMVHCSKMTIVSRNICSEDLPNGVIGYGLGKNLLIRAWRLWLVSLRCRHDYDKVFVHMTDRMVLMGWPIWALLGKEIYFWYAHGSVTWWLKVAVWCSRLAFSSSETGFRLVTSKCNFVGQGIDVDLFKPSDSPRKPELIAVSRINPSKRFEETLDFLAGFHQKYPKDLWIFRIIGPSQGFEVYVESLRAHARKLGLESRLIIDGSKEYTELPEIYSTATAFLSNSTTGSIDKVVLESLACGTPVIAKGKGYLQLPGVVDMSEMETAFSALHGWLSSPTTDWVARDGVVKNHSLKRLMLILAEKMKLG